MVVRENGASRWNLVADDVRLKAGKWVDVRGTIEVGVHEKKQTLILRPDTAKLVIEPPALAVGVVLNLEQLRFEHSDKGWSVAGGVHAALTKLPDPVRGLLPKPLKRLVDPARGLESVFAAGSDGISVTMTEFMDPLEIDLKTPVRSPGGKPVRGADNKAIPDVNFGKAAVKASDFNLTLSSDPSVSMKFGLALPSKLNHLFGTTDAGQPIHQVFEVYDQANKKRTSFVMFEASISTDSGISLAWADGLPFKTKDADAVKDGRLTISMGNDGEYGEFAIDLPRLSYNGVAFEASGGCYLNKDKPPAIPLCLLQQLLILAGFKDIAESLPRKVTIPLELSLIEKDGAQWRLKDEGFQQLADRMEDITGCELPRIRTALGLLSQADVVLMLPNGLCEYLDVRPPHGLTFKLAITPNGSISFAVKTQGEPFRVLCPSQSSPILQGITLSEVSLAHVMSGSLFLIKLTADFDNFYMDSLVQSIALQKIPVLPVMKDFHCRIIVHDLYCFVVLVDGIPIPIPTFFKELGLDSLGVHGVGAQAHAHFALPSPSLGDFAKVGSEFYSFFTDKSYCMPAQNPPKILPEFILEDCYIELPTYLGGALIGHKGAIANIDFNTIFAHLMNGLKFMSVADLLAILPIEYRVNRADASVLVRGFAGLEMNARWLISTPNEFAGPKAAYKRIDISNQADAETLLQLAPGAVSLDSTGIIIILAGRWGLLENAFDTKCVLVAQDMKSFVTGVRFEGMLTDPDPAFESEAHSSLEIAGLTIWRGDALVAVDSEQFSLRGDFNLLDETRPIFAQAAVGGALSGNAFNLDGTGNARILTVDATCAAHIGKDGVLLKLNIADKVGNTLQVTQSNDGQCVEIKGKLCLVPPYEYDATFSIDPRVGSIRGVLETSLVGGLVRQCIQMCLTK